MSTTAFDAFDLPDWLGIEPVTWRTEHVLSTEPIIAGRLSADDRAQALDLLAADAAYPRTVCSSPQRHDAHQAWHFGEVLLLGTGDRVAAAVPTVSFDPNLACEAIRRVAKALGAPSANFTVTFTL
ncbi:MAG: hypothetical protein ACR2JU_04600 [Nocardioidaceae bacterium]